MPTGRFAARSGDMHHVMQGPSGTQSLLIDGFAELRADAAARLVPNVCPVRGRDPRLVTSGARRSPTCDTCFVVSAVPSSERTARPDRVHVRRARDD